MFHIERASSRECSRTAWVATVSRKHNDCFVFWMQTGRANSPLYAAARVQRNRCMVCCISPADTNFEETLNSLKYANRAKNFKNKPTVNEESHTEVERALRNQIYALQQQVAQAGGPPEIQVDKRGE